MNYYPLLCTLHTTISTPGMITEDFTFPVITTNNNVEDLALLPPLWRISSINHSEPEQENGRKRKIFTSFPGENDASKAEAAAQEKMDVLWEGFNEELATTMDSSDSDLSEEADRNRNRLQRNSETLENRNELKLVPVKRKKLELIGKMIKKLLLLHNTAAIRRRGPT